METRETIHLGQIAIDFVVEADDSGGSHTVFECSVAAGARVPLPHSHDSFEETIYGLEGVSTFTVDGVAHEIAPGAAICIRRGQVHGFVNDSSEDTKFLAIATPGVFGPDYFRELAELVAGGGPPDPAGIAAVMGRHGLTPVVPVNAA
jgi:quercetin dioxygenase-like cupin family protein